MWQLYQIEVDCGYLHEPLENILNTKRILPIMNPHQRREKKVSTVSAASDSESTTQQATHPDP